MTHADTDYGCGFFGPRAENELTKEIAKQIMDLADLMRSFGLGASPV